MLKSVLKTAAALIALLLTAAPAFAAQGPTLPALMLANPAMGGGADGARSEAAIMEIFARLSDTGDKTPINPAQLALGQATPAALLPEGAHGPMMAEASKMLEPPMREGIARAYARKFSAAQLAGMNRFFATPTGRAFATESFAVQYDPEVLSATMQAKPVLITRMMGRAADLEARMKALPQERKIGELRARELDSLAKLVSSTPAALQDHAAQLAAIEVEAKLTVDDAAREGPEAEMPGDGNEAWFDRANWSAEDVAKVEKLTVKSSAISSQQIEAELAAVNRAQTRLEKEKK